MKNLCAITGSNGYVGGRLKNHFAASGWEILELTRRPKPNSRAVTFRLGGEISPSAFAGTDALVHCAYDFQPLRRDEIRAVNVEGSRKLLQAASAAGIPKIIFISSISAFDGCRSLYGQAKLEIEKIALENGALVIRPGLVHGDGSGGMFGKLTAQIRKSSVIPLIGDGSQIQFLVHNEDLCAFIENYAAGKIEMAPRILTAAHEQPWPFKKLLLEIARALGRKPKFIPLPWRFVWAGLKTAERCGLKLNFRSDSLVSLMNQNPSPDFSANAEVGLVCRPFQIEKIKITNGSADIHTGSSDWDKIFEVVNHPPKERIQWIRDDYDIRIGDFGWASPMFPKKEGLIHLTGYDENYRNIWYANFEAAEVRFIGRKPTALSKPNPFPVKSLIRGTDSK